MSNHAFTKKLRASIKTKIQEYGIDADDELPDYVMVLAANRKEKHQMKTDLQLFLGKHTAPFVEWLFEAFDRIQNLEADSTDDKSKKSVGASSSHVEKKKNDESAKPKRSVEKSPEPRRKEEKKRSPSIQSISPPPRISSVVVVPEKSKRDLSREQRERHRTRETNQRSRNEHNRYRSSRNDEYYNDRARRRSNEESNRYRSNERPRRRDPKEKPIIVSDSDEERKKPHRPSNAPKIHYDDSQKAGSSNMSPKVDAISSDDQQNEEVLMVGADTNDEKQNEAPTITRRFIIRVGNKEICRTVPMDDLPDLGSSKTANDEDSNRNETVQKRKRLADDPGRAVTRLMSDHISSSLSARMERFGKENVKKAKIDRDSDGSDRVEPYSPAPINPKEYDSEEEAKIDALLKSTVIPQTVNYQPSVVGLQYPQVFDQVVEMPRIAERCRFWPDCAKSQECPYHHPSKLCVKFPNCGFGSSCLNVHPMCKFDSKCAKLNCPFTHHTKGKTSNYFVPSNQTFHPKPSYVKPVYSINDSSDGNTDPLTSSASLVPCKYGNRCTATSCKYLHPKVCRYGLTCHNRTKGCPFRHLKPDLSQFTWISSA